ncbi:putative serine protease EDA2-like protein, partial [Trifolium pratense]
MQWAAISNDYTAILAKKFGAAVVSLEHRYYGKSKLLPYFTIMVDDNLVEVIVGVENPWFFFGGSYAGALSAWFRLKFPHLTCGSLASSAVVLAIQDFVEFDQQSGESVGPECKAVLQETTQLIETKLATNGKALRATFNANDLVIDGDFLSYLADAAVAA